MTFSNFFPSFLSGRKEEENSLIRGREGRQSCQENDTRRKTYSEEREKERGKKFIMVKVDGEKSWGFPFLLPILFSGAFFSLDSPFLLFLLQCYATFLPRLSPSLSLFGAKVVATLFVRFRRVGEEKEKKPPSPRIEEKEAEAAASAVFNKFPVLPPPPSLFPAKLFDIDKGRKRRERAHFPAKCSRKTFFEINSPCFTTGRFAKHIKASPPPFPFSRDERAFPPS